MFETEEGKWSIGPITRINLSHAKGMGSWFVAQEGVFGVTHSQYVCTLTLQCVDVEQSVADPTLLQNVVSRTIGDSHERKLTLAQEFHLKAESEQFIRVLL